MKKFLFLSLAVAALSVAAYNDHRTPKNPEHSDTLAGLGLAGAGLFFLGSIRTIRDANLSVTKALPAANASASTDGIQLGALTGGGAGAVLERVELELVVPDLPNLVDAHTATFTFEDSADGINYAAIPELAVKTLTGAGGAGAAGFTEAVRPPSGTRAFVRVTSAVSNGGGDNTAK